MEQITIVPPDMSDVDDLQTTLRPDSMVINNRATHENGLLILKGLKNAIKGVKERFAPVKKKAHDAHKSITAMEREVLEPFEAARDGLSGKILTYEREEKRRAEEERRKVEAEQRRKLEEARKKAEEERLARAIEADDTGNKKLADAILEEPEPVPVVATVAAPAPQIARVKGVSTVTRWKAEITDMKEFVEYVAKTGAWHLIKVNQVELDKMARGMKEAWRFPGARAVSETSLRG